MRWVMIVLIVGLEVAYVASGLIHSTALARLQ